jgi:hypothetical protein
MKFNVDTKIDINFTEEQIKQLLTDTIKQEMPQVTVEDITFVIKRNPTYISATVDASMEGFARSEPREKTPIIEEEEEETAEGTTSEKVTDFLKLD